MLLQTIMVKMFNVCVLFWHFFIGHDSSPRPLHRSGEMSSTTDFLIVLDSSDGPDQRARRRMLPIWWRVRIGMLLHGCIIRLVSNQRVRSSPTAFCQAAAIEARSRKGIHFSQFHPWETGRRCQASKLIDQSNFASPLPR